MGPRLRGDDPSRELITRKRDQVLAPELSHRACGMVITRPVRRRAARDLPHSRSRAADVACASSPYLHVGSDAKAIAQHGSDLPAFPFLCPDVSRRSHATEAARPAPLARALTQRDNDSPRVMAGLVPAIHVFGVACMFKTWMPGTSPGMTRRNAAPVTG